jgi:O-antigen/teichoic acid export membrane protein
MLQQHRRTVGNLVALTVIQTANALLPVVAYPVILRRVGAVPYAQIAVTESIAYLVLAVVIFSFDVEGVARIAKLDPDVDRVEISMLFSDILSVRLAILAMFLLVLLALSPFLEPVTFQLLLGWSLFPLAYILQSSWFFQGIERNVAPAIVVGVSRLGCLALLWVLVKEPADFARAPLIIGASYTAAGLVMLGVAVGVHRVCLMPPSLARAGGLLRSGKAIFIGNLSVALYRDSNVLVLNHISNGPVVAAYSVAEKAVKVFQAAARPLNQLAFPRVIRALRDIDTPSPRAFWTVLRYTTPQLALLTAGVAAASTVLVTHREWILQVMGIADASEILSLVAIMSVSVFLGVANFMFGTSGLNHLGCRLYLAHSILLTGVASLACSVALVYALGVYGAAIAFVLAEAILFSLIARAYFRDAAS